MNADHAGLTLERWGRFSFDQRLLSIGAEMNRADKAFDPPDPVRLRACYERTLFMTDLTVQLPLLRGQLRELLRFRELAGSIYVSDAPDRALHRSLLRALLSMSPASYAQIRELPALRKPNS